MAYVLGLRWPNIFESFDKKRAYEVGARYPKIYYDFITVLGLTSSKSVTNCILFVLRIKV